MIFIEHRRNRISELSAVDSSHGVEMDVRSDVNHLGEMHVSHEPWQRGDALSDWLKEYQRCGIRGPLLLNTKEDGLEEALFQACQQHQISHFFFLDTAWPTLIKYVRAGKGIHFMLRISKYEQLIQYDLLVGPGKIEWAWVDCFEGIPLDTKIIVELQKRGLKICLVSPELQGQPLSQIGQFKALFQLADAICTKSVPNWKSL